MTEQEIYNNQEFKTLRKILKKEFKWIKDVRLKGDPNKYSSLVFLEAIIDPWEFAEEENFTIAPYVRKDRELDFTGLSVFVNESSNDPILRSIENEIDKIIRDLHNTQALPSEYKLKDKRFSLDYFSYRPDFFPKK